MKYIQQYGVNFRWISVESTHYCDKCMGSKTRNRKGWNIWLRSFNETHWSNICLTQPTFTIWYPPFDIIFKLSQIINVFILLWKHSLPHNRAKISKRQFPPYIHCSPLELQTCSYFSGFDSVGINLSWSLDTNHLSP